MESERYLDLLDLLHAAAVAPPLSAAKSGSPGIDRTVRSEDLAREVLPALVNQPWKKLRRRVRRAARTRPIGSYTGYGSPPSNFATRAKRPPP